MKITVNQALEEGVAAHRKGRLQDAERFYRAILKSQPAHPDGNHNLGVLALSSNKTNEALPYFKAALEADPQIEQFWLSYISALFNANLLDDAKELCAAARERGFDGPKLRDLTTQLSDISQTKNARSVKPSQQRSDTLLKLYQNGRLSEAERLANSLCHEFPLDGFSWKILGAVLQATGRNFEALNANKQAVALSPQDAEAHNNLGVTLQDLRRLDDSKVSLTRAIELKPEFPEAHYNLGRTLGILRRLEEAEASYNMAIALKTDYADAYNNLANTLKELGRLDEAEEMFKKAIEFKGGLRSATTGLGNVLVLRGHHKKGLDLIRQGDGALFFGGDNWELI